MTSCKPCRRAAISTKSRRARAIIRPRGCSGSPRRSATTTPSPCARGSVVALDARQSRRDGFAGEGQRIAGDLSARVRADASVALSRQGRRQCAQLCMRLREARRCWRASTTRRSTRFLKSAKLNGDDETHDHDQSRAPRGHQARASSAGGSATRGRARTASRLFPLRFDGTPRSIS